MFKVVVTGNFVPTPVSTNQLLEPFRLEEGRGGERGRGLQKEEEEEEGTHLGVMLVEVQQ